MAIRFARVSIAASAAFLLLAHASLAREIEPHDEPTSVPECSHQMVSAVGSSNPVVAGVYEASVVEETSVHVVECSSVEGIGIAVFVVSACLPAEKVKTTSIDPSLFLLFPVMEVVATLANAGESNPVDMLVVSDFPAISIFPADSVGPDALPIAVVFPIALSSGKTVLYVAYKSESGIIGIAVDVDESFPLIFQNAGNVSIPEILPVQRAVQLNRFMRYGRFQYPSRMWRMQNVGVSLDANGETEKANALYGEFIRVFNEFVIRSMDDDEEDE